MVKICLDRVLKNIRSRFHTGTGGKSSHGPRRTLGPWPPACGRKVSRCPAAAQNWDTFMGHFSRIEKPLNLTYTTINSLSRFIIRGCCVSRKFGTNLATTSLKATPPNPAFRARGRIEKRRGRKGEPDSAAPPTRMVSRAKKPSGFFLSHGFAGTIPRQFLLSSPKMTKFEA